MDAIERLEPTISYLLTAIRNRNRDALSAGRGIPAGEIEQVISESPFAGFPTSDLKTVQKVLESNFYARQEPGATVAAPHKPWIQDYAGGFAYWDRLRSHMFAENKLPTAVINRLDQTTDELLDFCGNPEDLTPWNRRGMVMGHVQSGKTTNYGSLICKAADVGYKVIILLAGMTKDLRSQTQERVDEMFIGKAAEFSRVALSLHPIMQHDTFNAGHPAYGTTRLADFSLPALKSYGVSLDNLKDPIIFVVKKNNSILENLGMWMDNQFGERKSDYPLLVVDDEADYASVNTKSNPEYETTAINSGIRSILKRFNRKTYIGYTATPFANIFIQPDTEADMRKDEDLFPKHFIHSLDPPTNYSGASRIFGEQGDLVNAVSVIEKDAYDDIIPLKHKKELIVEELPETLYEAIRTFILARALRNLRGQTKQHATMMINVSRLVAVQSQIADLAYEYLTEVENSIRLHAKKRGWSGDHNMEALEQTLNTRFINDRALSESDQSKFASDDVLDALPTAVGPIVVRKINGSREGEDLDYSQHKQQGKALSVIAVGGNRLSRGLTLEGLCVSYMLRATGAADTLLQMARWFGYRPDYEDLCRIWINKEAYSDFKFTHDAVEELREELKIMQVSNQTPEQFGLKVRRSETGIRITSHNKMRTAQPITWAQDFEGRIIDGYALVNNKTVNRNNMLALKKLAESLGPCLSPDSIEDEAIQKNVMRHLVWRNVPAKSVLTMLEAFKFHPSLTALLHLENKRSLFSDYVSERAEEYPLWDLVIPLLKEAPEGLSVTEFFNSLDKSPSWIRGRLKGLLTDSDIPTNRIYKPNGMKNSVRDPREDAPMLLSKERRGLAKSEKERLEATGNKIGMDKLYSVQREKPLLLAHVFRSDLDKADAAFELGDTPVVSCSFAMPRSSITLKERRYQINAVLAQQISQMMEEDLEGEDYDF